MEKGRLLKEVADFAALLILLCSGKQSIFCFFGQELANAGHWEDDLLHAPVQAHYLEKIKNWLLFIWSSSMDKFFL